MRVEHMLAALWNHVGVVRVLAGQHATEGLQVAELEADQVTEEPDLNLVTFLVLAESIDLIEHLRQQNRT